MYDYGAKYKSLCEAQCRRYKVYADIYNKTGMELFNRPVFEYSHTLTSYGSKDAIISIKATRGQTTGGFSFGNAYSGQLTMVVTPEAIVENDGGKIEIFVSFIDDSDAESVKVPLGVFFIQSVTKAAYSKTIKAVDGITFLSKYFTNWSPPPISLKDMFYWCTRLAKLDVANQAYLNNPIITQHPFKNEAAENDSERFYTCREYCCMLASANAGNVVINSKGEVMITISDFSKKNAIPLKSVISYTDSYTENKFTSVFWAATYTGASLPSTLDPQSSKYDPSIMVVNFPLAVDESVLSPKQMEANIEKKVSDVQYSGIIVKKRGTGLYEIGDVLTLNDTYNYKRFDNIFVMGITYTISASEGFTETLYSLAKTESQQQTQGITLMSEISKGGKGGALPPVTGITVNNYGDFALDTNEGAERYVAVF